MFFPLLAAGFVAGGVSLVVRYRRSRGEERLQLRWLAAAVTLLMLAAPLFTLGEGSNPIVTSVFVGTLCLIPLAAAIAVVRYRLYDIDVVVNRALGTAG